MRKSRFIEAQIIGMLKEQEAGMPTAEVCRRHGLSPGLVTHAFRSLNSFKRPFVRMPRGFCRLAMSAAAVGYKTR